MTQGSTLLQLTRRYGLIALMLFVFTGVQVVQASPLHDHSQHTIDCGLWHVPVANAVTASAVVLPDYVAQGPALLPGTISFPQATRPSPYQGRAPPVFLS